MKNKNKPSARKVVLTSVLVDLSDIALNTLVAYMTGSVVMIAEAIQGGADLISASLLYVGLKRSGRPADKLYPFGYGREMYVWALVSAFIMFVGVSGLSIYFGAQRLSNPEPLVNIPLAVGMLILAMGTNGYALSLSARRIGDEKPSSLFRKFSRSQLIESKTALILDLVGTLAAAVGFIALIIFIVTGDVRFDAFGAIGIGVLMAVFAIVLIWEARGLLVGRSAGPDVEELIRKTALSHKEVEEVLDLKTSVIGINRLLVNIEVHIKENLTTNQIERLIDKIKERVAKEVPSASHIQVELETPDRELLIAEKE